MEIVIKIPKGRYEDILSGKEFILYQYDVREVLKNGIPLPKGHGRIADIDKMLEEMKATRTYDISFAMERVKPIVEADTENENPEMEKLQKIEQIIKDHDEDRMPEDYFYIDKIREVLNNGEN